METTESSLAKKRRWQSLFAAFSGWTLDAMDNMFLALALPLIGKTFDLSLTELGFLVTATLAGAGIGGMFAGSYADKYGRVNLLTWTMTGYAVFTGLCGFAQSYTQLLVLRFIVGLFLGAEWGPGAALVSEYWPEKYRARATAFVHSGFAVGFLLASLLFMYIVPAYGWQALFFVGVLPAFVALAIRKTLPEPEAWTETKKQESVGAVGEISVGSTFSVLFSSRYMRYTILTCILSSAAMMAFWGSASWLPTYLAKVKGLDVVKTGSYMILLNLGAFCGHNTLGLLADKKGRRFSFLFGLVGSIIVTVLYVMIDAPQVLLLFGMVFGFFTYGYFGMFGAYLSEIFPVEARASGVSFTFSVGKIFAMASPYLIGYVGTVYGLGFGIGLTSLFYFLGVVAILLLPETRNSATSTIALNTKEV